MVTASHLPFNRNGFKLFDNKAGFEKGEVADLLRRATEDAASGGGLQDDPSFPADKRQAEEGEIARLESSLSILSSLVSKAGFCPSTDTNPVGKPKRRVRPALEGPLVQNSLAGCTEVQRRAAGGLRLLTRQVDRGA